MGKWMDGYLERLNRVREANLTGGREARIDIQHGLGKCTARERIAGLVDEGSFDEIGSLVTDPRPPLDGRTRPCPSDGVVMGFARVDGKTAAVCAMDFSVLSGSLGSQAAWKLADWVDMAGQKRMPLITLFDTAGLRIGIKAGDCGLAGMGRFIRNYSRYSGVIPRIALVLGPCTGLMAAAAILSDFLIMTEDTAFLWYGGEKQSDEAGTAEFHMERSGQCDVIARDDEDAIQCVRVLLRFLPGSCWERPPFEETRDDVERREAALLDVMPDDPKFTYDIHEIIELIVDRGTFLELKADYASHLVIGFCRFGGHGVGLVANNPDELSGILEPDSSDKYDRFMRYLDAFNIPLVTLVDTTAFPPGDRWERMGVIRHGAKLLHSYAHLTCPKITMVLRRSYGGANIVLGCSRMFPDLVYTWPTAEFAPTGPETVVHAVFHKALARAKEEGNYDAVFNQFLTILKEQFSVMTLARTWTSYYTAHEVIDPRDTRPRIIKALEAVRNKHETLPEKKRSIVPA
ncbi:MAG: carboxyl transferase domain-containing protein [Deltaproteobacteria bacterium]|nr:carboxyl transferase domain-containing protein [Deltaproteobacteria bacterium]